MKKKISTTFWFTVAIAIVALLAYTEVGAEDDPKVLKFGNSEITVELYPDNKVIVLDTKTMKPFGPNVQLFICGDKDGKMDPESCNRAEFLNPGGCFVRGNPTYYGHGGDGYRRP